jgi:small subunit ribosomal protein S6
LRDYELVVVLSPSLGDEGFPASIERINGVIQGNGGEIKNVDQWGRRRLAYPIKRNLDAYYVVTKFAAEPTAIRPLENNLDLAEDVLRHLVIKLDNIKPYRGKPGKVRPEGMAFAPSVVMAEDSMPETIELDAPAPETAAEAAEPDAAEPDAAAPETVAEAPEPDDAGLDEA